MLKKIFVIILLLSPIAFTEDEVKVIETPESIKILHKDKLVLKYHIKEVDPPKGVHSAYKKNGFIHPLLSPKGESLTSIHPKDHYHHTGIWHAWVNTKYGSAVPDFWNSKHIQFSLEKKKLRRTPAKVKCVKVKALHANGFTVELHHLAFLKGADEKPTIVLKEDLKVSVKVKDNIYIIDYDMNQKNVSAEDLTCVVYRYGGGIAYRGPSHWDKENSDYLTSDGLNRTNSHTSKANWVAMTGVTKPDQDDYHGLAILCHPSNFDAPQHIRTWDIGEMFFNYVPAQSKALIIKADQIHSMKYRLLAYDGKVNKENIEKLYREYVKEVQ